jgi:hypothetical protein
LILTFIVEREEFLEEETDSVFEELLGQVALTLGVLAHDAGDLLLSVAIDAFDFVLMLAKWALDS